MGNLEFQNLDTGCAITPPTNPFNLYAAELLGFLPDELLSALTNRTIQVRGETTIVPLSAEQSYDTRNAFTKEIYGRLFAQIVWQANKSLAFVENDLVRAENIRRDQQHRRRVSINGTEIFSIGLLGRIIF